MNNSPTIDISVALPAYNEEFNIVRVLDDVVKDLNAIGRSWEVIVVDNCSSDHTAERVLEYIKREPRVQLICAAMGWEGRLVKMSITADGVSTSEPAHRELWARDGGYYGEMFAPVVTWADIHNQFGSFDFVNIDAEGISAELFFRLMETEARPHCICVEHDGRTTEILARQPNWYNCVYANGTNLVLVRKG